MTTAKVLTTLQPIGSVQAKLGEDSNGNALTVERYCAGGGGVAMCVRPHNVTLTDEMWEHAVRRYGKRGVAAALEDAYRTVHGLAARPDVSVRGQFQPGENGRKRRRQASNHDS